MRLLLMTTLLVALSIGCGKKSPDGAATPSLSQPQTAAEPAKLTDADKADIEALLQRQVMLIRKGSLKELWEWVESTYPTEEEIDAAFPNHKDQARAFFRARLQEDRKLYGDLTEDRIKSEAAAAAIPITKIELKDARIAWAEHRMFGPLMKALAPDVLIVTGTIWKGKSAEYLDDTVPMKVKGRWVHIPQVDRLPDALGLNVKE